MPPMTAAAALPLSLDLARGDGWKAVYERELKRLDRLRARRRMTESAFGLLLTTSGVFIALLAAASLLYPEAIGEGWAALDAALTLPWLPVAVTALAAILLPAAVLLLATFFLTRIESLRRRMTEQEARVTFCEIARGKARSYALCLRSAEAVSRPLPLGARVSRTASFIVGSPVRWLTPAGQATLRRRQAQLFLDRRGPDALDAAILNDMLDEMPVLVLGFSDGGAADLSGRLSPEDEAWNETVSLLLAGASRIFCQPDLSGGPVWELGRLKTLGLLPRTAFVMPPEALMPGPADLHGRTWDRLAMRAASGGLMFPAWTPAGCFFRLDETGSCAASLPFDVGKSGFFTGLHAALEKPAPPPAAPSAPAPAMDDDQDGPIPITASAARSRRRQRR